MSRFWAGGSSSESDNASDDDSFAEVQNQRTVGKFAAAFDSDSESEDEVRVVKSQKDKAWESIHDCVTRMRSAMKINDWSSLLDEFELLGKQIEKSKMLIMKEGLPKFYIKILVDLEDFVNVTAKDKEAQKKMKPLVLRSFNRMKLVVKKHNKAYETEIQDCRDHPENYVEEVKEESSSEEESESSDSDESDSDESDSDEESEEGSDSDSDSEVETKKKKPAKVKFAADSDESDDDSWPSEAESDSESSDDEVGVELKGRDKWLKRAVDTSVKEKKDAKRAAKRSEQPKQKRRENFEVVSKGKVMWRFDENMTEEALEKKLSELVASRGRKGVDTKSVFRQLEVLSKISRYYGPRKEISVLMHLLSAMFDNSRSIDEYMDISTWKQCYFCLTRIMRILAENPALRLGVIPVEDVTDYMFSNRMKEEVVAPVPTKTEEAADDNVLKLVGNVESFLVRLESEYTKSLQQINPHTQDYVVRLSDEAMLLDLAEMVQQYFIRAEDYKAAANIALLRVEHIYYKHDTMANAVKQAHLFTKTWGRYADLHPACIGKPSDTRNITVTHPAAWLGKPSVAAPQQNMALEMESLTNFVFKHGDERTKTRALLCSVFHNALHDRYYVARDLFLMSHIQEHIDKMETKTQILYNRALVTLGLCAFRTGLLQKAYDCLSTICSGRVRELLAQGPSRWQPDKDIEQEKAERRRQIPYHMHINPDLLECTFLVCATVLELPVMVLNPGLTQRTHFKKFLGMYNRQLFTGPPENTREHVLSAAKSLLNGDWQKGTDLILNLEVWNLIPGDGSARVKAMLAVTLKETALKLYLYTTGQFYETLSLSYLVEMFEIEEKQIKKIISKMIFHKELSASWDYNNILVLHKVDATATQTLALAMADKLAYIVENNERILDPLTSTYGYKEDWSNRDNRKYGGDSTRRNPARPQWKTPHPGRGGRGRGRGGRGSQRGKDGEYTGKKTTWGTTN